MNKKKITEDRHKKVIYCLTSFTRNSSKDKTLETESRSSFRGINEKIQERTFDGDRNVQYLSNSVKNYTHLSKLIKYTLKMSELYYV